MNNPSPTDGDLRIHEVTPRDGLQNEDEILGVSDRLELTEQLIEAGYTDIEVGSFVHPDWVPQMAGTDELFGRLDSSSDVRLWSLVPNRRGLSRAIEANCQNIATFLSASETHNKNNMNRSVKESLDSARKILSTASQRQMGTRAYISTVFGCPYEGDVSIDRVLELTEELFDAGAETVCWGDTIGVGGPLQVRRALRRAREEFGQESLALHFHDTQGLALTNIYIAYRLGFRHFDAALGGLGGCPYAEGAAGNVSTEDLVNMFEKLDTETGLELSELIEISKWIESELEFDIRSSYYRYATG